MLAAAFEFAADYKANAQPYWLSFLGSSGTGKTMLLDAVRDRLADRFRSESGIEWSQKAPRFYWPDVAKALQSGDYNITEEIIEPELVFIDELGLVHDPNRFIAVALSRICERRMGKWTAFTANLLMPQIADKIDPRVASRMKRDGNRAIQFTGVPDFASRALTDV